MIEEQAARQLPEASHTLSEAPSAAPESLSAPNTPAQSQEAAASRGGFSLSPQPSQQLQIGMPHEQQEQEGLKQTAPAAQASAPAAREENQWQQVRSSQRKVGSQRAARLPSACKAPKQSRRVPNQDSPPLLLPQLQKADQPHREAQQDLQERPQPGLGHEARPHEQVQSASLAKHTLVPVGVRAWLMRKRSCCLRAHCLTRFP